MKWKMIGNTPLNEIIHLSLQLSSNNNHYMSLDHGNIEIDNGITREMVLGKKEKVLSER